MPASLKRLQLENKLKGIRRTIEIVVLAHQNSFPHIILFQAYPNVYELPNIELKCDEDEFDGLNRCLEKV